MTKNEKPKHNALSVEKASDGMFEWETYRIDNTKEQTEADWRVFLNTVDATNPFARIEQMEAALAELKNITPAMQVQIDAIRAIHAKVQAPPVGFTRERLLMLDQADAHWEKLLLLRDAIPMARKGAAHSKKQSKSASAPRKLKDGDAEMAATEYWRRKAAGDGYGLITEIASRYDVTPKTIRMWSKRYKPD